MAKTDMDKLREWLEAERTEARAKSRDISSSVARQLIDSRIWTLDVVLRKIAELQAEAEKPTAVDVRDHAPGDFYVGEEDNDGNE